MRNPDNSQVGTWEMVIRNAETLQKGGLTPYFLHTLTGANVDGLDALQAELMSRNWNFRISLFRTSTPPSTTLQEKVGSKLESLLDRVSKTLPLRTNLERHIKFAEWNTQKKKTLSCGAGRNYFAVDSKARISACQMDLNRKMADLHENSIASAKEAISADDTLKYFANPQLRTGGCASCFYRHTCAGGCLQHTNLTSKTVNRPSPWCRVYGQIYPAYIRAIAEHQLRRLNATLKH